MRKIAAMVLLCSLLLVACAPKETPVETQPQAVIPVSNVTVTRPDGTTERKEQVYDESGCILKVNHYENEKLLVSYNVTSDSEGRVLTMTDDAFGTGISMVYTYDAKGRKETVETKRNGETFFIQSYTYHEDGKEATYTEEDLRSSSTVSYKYSYEDGNLRWEEYYENGQLLFSWEYGYNADNERVEGTQRNSDFLVVGSRTYARENNVTTVTTLHADGSVRDTKTIQQDANGSVVKEIFTQDGETTVTEYTYLQKN